LPKGPRKGTAVVWSGLIHALDEMERTAVIAPERAHLDFRHDVLVIPFAAWHRALPYFSATAIGLNSVNRLIELMADDQAREHVDPQVLARAVRSAAAISPEHRSDLSTQRIRRLSEPLDSRRIPVRLLSIGPAALLLLLPTLLILPPSTFGIWSDQLSMRAVSWTAAQETLEPRRGRADLPMRISKVLSTASASVIVTQR